MSRQELAEAVNAWVHTMMGKRVCIDANYIGKIERGTIRWPCEWYRAAFRAVLGVERDAGLGFFSARGGMDDSSDPLPDVAQGSTDAAHSGSTVLRAILAERHWQTYRVFRVRFCRAARELGTREDDPSLRALDVSERQFQRWIHGARPRPDACRVLESMFGVPVARLCGPAEPATARPGVDMAPRSVPVARVVDGFAVPDAGAGTAVRVSVSGQAGAPVTVVCPDGAAGRVAVEVGAIRVLIDASGTNPGGVFAPVVDVPPLPVGGARVYSLAQRRAV